MKMLNKSCRALLTSAFLLLGVGWCESSANAAGYVVSNLNGSGAGSLRAAVTSANSDGVDSDITFDSTFFSSLKTVALGGSELGLANNGKLSITGPTAGVEISGGDTSRVFSVGAGANVTLNGLMVSRGKSDKGAGINNAGNLIVNNCTITSNQSSEFGGGVYNTGTLAVNYCTISGNTATSQNGGGIHNGNDVGNISAVLTMTGCLLRNNKAVYGAGLENQYGSTATATNCTFYNNVANERGGGIYNGGNANITNCSFVVNYNLSAKSGAGVCGFPNYYIGLTNCLGVQNSPDNFVQFSDNGGNVQASSVQEAGLNPTGLANNGGPTETIAIVSRGTAVNAGINSAISAFPYDQRGSGYPRIVGGNVDSGAYESNFSPVLVNNNGLTVQIGAIATITEDMLKATDAVTNPLTYTLTSGTSHGTVKLNGNPTNTFTQNDIAAGNVSYTQDGSVVGSDSFGFKAGDGKGGYVSGTFAITIPEPRSLVVTTTADSEANDGQTSLREAINFANEDGVDSAITFDATVFAAPRKTITLRGDSLYIVGNGTVSITAPAAGVIINGNNASSVFETQSDASVTFKGLTISGGNAEQGGGIKNNATLLVDSCTLSGNTSSYAGGAIYSENNGTGGSLTIRNSTLTGNSASVGGGLYNSVGSTRIENSTITGNSAPDNSGGGIICAGDMFTPVGIFVSNSIIAGNTGTDVDYEFGNMNSDNIHSEGYNLIGDGNGLNFFYGDGDILGTTNPGLAALNENGGPTKTIALLPSSPAFNAGNPGFNGTGQFDQRGSGFARVRGGRLDIGAVEIDAPQSITSLVVNTLADTNDGVCGVDDCSLHEAVDAANSNGDVSTITFKAGLSGTIQLASQLTIETAVNLNGPNNQSIVIAGNGVTGNSLFLTSGIANFQVSNLTLSNASAAIENTATVVVTGCTLTGNGKAVVNNGEVTLINSTLSGNEIGTYNLQIAQVSRCTISGNGTGISYQGGTLDLNNSIVAGNSTDVTGPLHTDAFNLKNMSAAAAGLSPDGLQFNGGPTKTIALLPGSIAFNAGDPAFSGTGQFDQRGTGFPRVQNGRLDIGAFESAKDTTAPTVVIVSPSNNQTLSPAAFTIIAGSATDNVGVAQVQIKLFRTRNGVTQFWNGSSFGAAQTLITVTLATPNATSTTWSYEVSPELRSALDLGAYSVVAYGKDSNGNTSGAIGRNFTIIKDSAAPVPTIATPTQNQSLTFAAFNSITGAATDNVGVTQVLVKLFRTRNGVNQFWNGSSFGSTQVQLPANVTSPGSTNVPWSFPVTPELKAALDQGPYLLAVYAKDATGNQSGAVGRNFVLNNDVTAPVATITNPTQNQSLTVTSFNTITGSATDAVGVTQVFVKLFRTRNGVTTFWDGTQFGAAQVLLPATLASPGGTSTNWSYAVSPQLKAALDNGAYLLAVYAKDAAGNQSGAVGRNFNISGSSTLVAGQVSAPAF